MSFPLARLASLATIMAALMGGASVQVDQVNAVYQFGFESPKLLDDPMFAGKTAAFLWVPPHVERLHAVLLAPANIIERRVADDPIIRDEATRDNVAIVFFQAGWGKGAMDSPALADYVQKMLDTLADQSGYAELKTVPWIPMGHSGNSQFVQGISRLKPERIVANVVIKGGLPAVPKDGSTKGIVGIPTFFCNGEFEEVMPPGKVRNAWWGVSIERFHAVRKAVPEALYSGMEDKDHGHIHWLPPMQQYLALFLHKAMVARVDPSSQALKMVAFNSGWLVDPDEKAAAAPVGKYKGDPADAFWLFDEEQAKAWKVLFDHDEGKKEQLIAFEQNGEITPFWSGWGLQTIAFQPLADGVTFKVKARFRDEVPEPFADAHTRLGHAAGGEMQYQVVGWAGSTEQIGPDTFKLRFDREGFNGRTTHILIGALHPGDANYRETVAVATFDVAATNGGMKQTVEFPKIADQRGATTSIPLHATSDAGLPVQYYVSWGPAQIVGSTLTFTDLPDRAQYPIEVRVTAYQWGKSTMPMVNTATPMTQLFHILKK
jgi:hypothetical protein